MRICRDFREAFLDGYLSVSDEVPFDLDALLAFTDLRVNALHAWLADPPSAPIGTTTATPRWRAALERFVEHYRNQTNP